MTSFVRGLCQILALATIFSLVACADSNKRLPHQNELQERADIIFHSGAIYTVDANRSWAEAVAIKNEKIIYVGSDSGVEQFLAKTTRVINLEGRMMLPGFQDAHVHPIEAGMAYLGCSLHDGKSVDDYVRLVAECSKNNPDAAFIDGAWLDNGHVQ
jgi:predicted amidohydrolase YtcJ